MARNRNKGNQGFYGNAYCQSADFNRRYYHVYIEWILGLAQNRFKWLGLPDTCDSRFLEQTLTYDGIASIAQYEGVWASLKACAGGELNMYGIPTSWRAIGGNGITQYDADWNSGALVYASRSRTSIFNYAELMARKLAHYDRTEDLNLLQVQNPIAWTAPKDRLRELTNLVKNTYGGEGVIVGDDELMDGLGVRTIDTGAKLIVDQLNPAKQNVWSSIYRYLGIEHLAFEKNERMIEQEAQANSRPTEIKLMDELDARRDAAKYLREKFPDVFGELEVVFNEDVESYNWGIEEKLEVSEDDEDLA